MVSVDYGLDRTKQKNTPKKAIAGADKEAKEISWLIDNLPVSVFRVANDSSFSMIYASKNIEELTGYSKEDFLSKKISWADIIYSEDVSKVDKVIQKAVKTKASYQVEYRIKRANGNVIFIQEEAHVV